MIPKQDKRSACADKNDGLGWLHGASFRYEDRVLGLRTDDLGLLEECLAKLPPLGESCEEELVNGLFSLKKGGAGKRKGVRHYFVLYDGWTRVARTFDKDEALSELQRRWTASLASIAHMETIITRPALVFEKDGLATACLGLPQERHQELNHNFQNSGHHLVSDLALILNLEGQVRSLSSTQVGDIQQLRAQAFKLASVLFFEDTPEILQITPGQGALRLVSQTIGNAALPGEMAALANAFKGAACRLIPKDAELTTFLPLVA